MTGKFLKIVFLSRIPKDEYKDEIIQSSMLSFMSLADNRHWPGSGINQLKIPGKADFRNRIY
jgi:predicted RNA-binding protein with PUA domain